MSHIKHTTQFMLQLMGHKVTTVIATACQIIVCKTACPHNLRTGIIVIRLGMQNFCISHYGTKKTFCQGICDLHIATIGKITFHGMHHNIGTSGFRLVIRQGFGKFRIHNRKLRSCQVIIISSLFQCLLIGDHTAP